MQLDSYRIVPKVLLALGFVPIRKTKTSHEIWHKEGAGNITLSKHKGKDLKLSTLSNALKRCGVDWSEFQAKYKEVI